MSIAEAAWLTLPAAVVYMLPAILACARRSPLTCRITAVNALLGWTVIGWLRALRLTFSPPAARRGERHLFAVPSWTDPGPGGA